ncbi:NAD(P)-binding protein [Xylaria sp. CBS 124048]|nr:NAD(P)-binding protein [Xylaria sp. CBS 124048]
MTSLNIDLAAIPDLTGKTAVITGGSSGIGLEAVKIMVQKGATVHILDRNEPGEAVQGAHFHQCSVTNWAELRTIMTSLGPFHMVFANAGVVERTNYFDDQFDADGHLAAPDNTLLEINLCGVLHTVKLAWSIMKRHGIHGSIVLTASTTAYSPEVIIPVYSAGKAALVNLVRSLRHCTILDHITINAVAPAGTLTPMIAEHSQLLIDSGVLVSKPSVVGMALVYSATATQDRRVDVYGREKEGDIWKSERWNGRVIYTLGDTYTELEETTADLRPFWFGKENWKQTRFQQAATDYRQGVDEPRM